MELTLELKRLDTPIHYKSTPLPVGKQIDMGLELMEIVSPVVGVFSVAGGVIAPEVVNAITENAGPAFGKVARSLITAGGSQYIIKLFEECKVTRTPMGGQPVQITRGNFELRMSGKGGAAEVMKVTRWLVQENFMDFILEALASNGQQQPGAGED